MKKLSATVVALLLSAALVGTAQSLSEPPSRLVPQPPTNSLEAYRAKALKAGRRWPAASSIRSTSPAARTTADPCNLLPNSSFEDQNVSALSGNRFNVYNLRGGSLDELSGWMSTNGSTPDYFATNAPAGSDSNPSSTQVGAFTPHNFNSGLNNGTVGLFVRPASDGATSDQEYITPRAGAIHLKGSYYAAFFAYRDTYGGSNNTTKLGLDLRTSDPRSNVIADVYAKTSNSIESAGYVSGATWTPVQGTIKNVPEADYYVNIGNISPTTQSSSGLAYYLIDDVALYKIPEAGSSIQTCGTTVTLGQGCDPTGGNIAFTYDWTSNPSSSTPLPHTLQISVAPYVTTVYTLTVHLPNGEDYVSSATITVPQPAAGPEHDICPGTSVVLGTGCDIPGYTYSWSAAGTFGTFSNILHPTVQPTQSTTYSLRVRRPNGTSYTSLTEVNVLTVITNAPDINLARQGQPGPSGSNLYDIRVNNVDGATSFTYYVENPDGNGGWTASGSTPFPLSSNVYTGPDNSSFNEQQGFTTFHTGLIGPASSGSTSGGSINPPATYRITVTAYGSCNNVVAQKVITLPPYGGEYGEGSRWAYPNPATETLSLPVDVKSAALLNSQGQPVKMTGRGSVIDVQYLPAGLYNLRMVQDGKVVNQRIEVKH